jgi:hypothetical protein
MTSGSVIFAMLFVLMFGFIQVFRRNSRLLSKIKFTDEYRNKFIQFSNQYFETYDRFNRSGDVHGELYVWLTMNVNKIQNMVGTFGVMSYKPAFQNYMIHNYYIIINTIPKFREGPIESFDVNSVDDCLLRYLGHLEELLKNTQKNLRNPIIWFREGFKEIISVPIFLLNWFGIISNKRLSSIKSSVFYKIVTGLIALVTLVSGIVTIVVGYDQTIEFIKNMVFK